MFLIYVINKMKISNIQIKNFRNLKDININLDQHTVIVGENGTGKSNFLFALRLVLDPSLPDSRRNLNSDDFWEGLERPFSGDEIEIKIDFKEFEDNTSLMACLADSIVDSSDDKSTARLGYCYKPRSKIQDKKLYSKDEYEFIVYRGNDKNKKINYDLRNWIQISVLKALRDAEKDFKNKYNSPLTPFLERIYDQIDLSKLEDISKTINESSNKITNLEEINQLKELINDRLRQMVGSNHSLEPSFGINSAEANQILNSLKLFLNNKQTYGFSNIGLGHANLIYLLLLILNIEVKQKTERLASCILGIEEPEAHLHPQVQRLIFSDIFKSHNPTITTTHSPNIVSVAPLRSIVLLKNKGNYSDAKSLFNISLTKEEIDDLQRYIDVTRGEIFFAKGVIFVEGLAEVFLFQKIAQFNSINLDQYGISICSVNGTDFLPYIKLVGKNGLDIPFVVITDGDLSKQINGYSRAQSLLINLENNGLNTNLSQDSSRLYEFFKEHNLFVGEETLEVDLIKSAKRDEILVTYKELNPNAQQATLDKIKKIVDGELFSSNDYNWLIDKINEIGKGRFSQRLASNLTNKQFPKYVIEAILKIKELVKNVQ